MGALSSELESARAALSRAEQAVRDATARADADRTQLLAAHSAELAQRQQTLDSALAAERSARLSAEKARESVLTELATRGMCVYVSDVCGMCVRRSARVVVCCGVVWCLESIWKEAASAQQRGEQEEKETIAALKHTIATLTTQLSTVASDAQQSAAAAALRAAAADKGSAQLHAKLKAMGNALSTSLHLYLCRCFLVHGQRPICYVCTCVCGCMATCRE